MESPAESPDAERMVRLLIAKTFLEIGRGSSAITEHCNQIATWCARPYMGPEYESDEELAMLLEEKAAAIRREAQEKRAKDTGHAVNAQNLATEKLLGEKASDVGRHFEEGSAKDAS